MNGGQVKALVATELARIDDHRRRDALVRLAVEPVASARGWAYGPGRYECWTVARDDGRGIELVYSLGAFDDPWGWLVVGSDDLGTDAQWYASLDDAFIASLWDGPLPPGYEVS